MSGTILAAAAAALLQQPAGPALLSGLWEGTIGDQPVRACFGESDAGPFGAYYTTARLQLIPLLTVSGPAGTFTEGSGDGTSPLWRIEQAGADQLRARWTGGGRTLPVRLRRLAAPTGEESPCASPAFHAPRIASVRTVRTRATHDGTEFTRLTLDTSDRFRIGVTTFALDGDSAAIRRVNEALAAPLAGDPPRWFECIGTSLQNGGIEGNYNEELRPEMISRHWLSVSYYQGGYCGGAHPDGSSTNRLFDLTTGAEVDTHDWFNTTAVRRERIEGADEELRTMLPPLRTFILRNWVPQEAGCGEVIRAADYWTIGLTRDGFTFSPLLAHATAVCEEEWTYNFDELRPFLTPEAQALIEALRAERR